MRSLLFHINFRRERLLAFVTLQALEFETHQRRRGCDRGRSAGKSKLELAGLSDGVCSGPFDGASLSFYVQDRASEVTKVTEEVIAAYINASCCKLSLTMLPGMP